MWIANWSYVAGCVMGSPWMKSQEYDEIVTDDVQFGHSNTHEEEGVTALGIAAIMGLLLSLYWTTHVP